MEDKKENFVQFSIVVVIVVQRSGMMRTQELYYYGSTIVQFVLQKKGSIVPRRFCGHTVDKSFGGV
jgi:hypothetical protein